MYSINFSVSGLEKLKVIAQDENFFKKHIRTAVEASLFEVQKNAFDSEARSPYFFNFKKPRSLRTGFLAATFRLDIANKAKNLIFNQDVVTAEVFSTVRYADIVAFENDFYSTILDGTRKEIDKHFEAVAELALKELGLA